MSRKLLRLSSFERAQIRRPAQFRSHHSEIRISHWEVLMNLKREWFLVSVILLCCSLSAAAQTPPAEGKQFVKDGLSFNYPSAWAFNDTSNPDAQQMTFGRTDSEAQITVFVFRTP